MIWNDYVYANPREVVEYFRGDGKGFFAWVSKIIWG